MVQSYFNAGGPIEPIEAALAAAYQAAAAWGVDGVPTAQVDAQAGIFAYYRAALGPAHDFVAAQAIFERCLPTLAPTDQHHDHEFARFYYGVTYQMAGDIARASDIFHKVYANCQRYELPLVHRYVARHLGQLAMGQGEYLMASGYYEEALILREVIGFQIMLPFAQLSVAEALVALGDVAAAQPHFDAALALAQTMHVPRATMLIHLALGSFFAGQGDSVAATTHDEHALNLAQTLEHQAIIDQIHKRQHPS